MTIDALLNRLDHVRRCGTGYRARCPACGCARRDVLSLTETDDGTILLHCFYGCAAAEVVQAVGLTLADLFPTRYEAHPTDAQRRAHAREHRMAQWKAALVMLAHEALLIEVAAEVIANGEPLSDDERTVVHASCARIHDARAVLAEKTP